MRIGSSALNVNLAQAQPHQASMAEPSAQSLPTSPIAEKRPRGPDGARGDVAPRQPFVSSPSTAQHLPDKNGVGCSRNPSAGSSSGVSASEVFGYRTAEISNPNRNSCVGLTAEWLRIRNDGSAGTRMDALKLGSPRAVNAANRQLAYHNEKKMLLNQRMDPHIADIRAQNAVMQAVGLTPTGAEKKYKSADALNFLNDLTRTGATHLLGLYFADGTAHSVAVATSKQTTTLFDPNYGEFTVHKMEADRLLRALSAHYQNVSTITTQKID